ncbi:hypothetical protein HA402_005346 [Bradysia odoriphaga]|nr:hypothetical protein HA402_005346 [Bradysia odoriphaga]
MEKKIDQFVQEYRKIHGKRPPKIFKTKARELDYRLRFYEEYLSEGIRDQRFEAVKMRAIQSVDKSKTMFEELSKVMADLLEYMFSTELTSDSENSASD